MSDDEITRLLRATLDAAVSYIFALEGQKEAVVVRARRAYEAALRALDEAEQLDVSPAMGGMTPAEAYEFYADPTNQEPQGPPVRRKSSQPEVNIDRQHRYRCNTCAVTLDSPFPLDNVPGILCHPDGGFIHNVGDTTERCGPLRLVETKVGNGEWIDL